MSVQVGEILEWIDGTVVNRGSDSDSYLVESIEKPADLKTSTLSDIAFFFSKAFSDELVKAKPKVLVTGEAFVEPLKASGLPLWKDSLIVSVKDPYLAMAFITQKFSERLHGFKEVSKSLSSDISSEAQIGENVNIGPNVVIEAGVIIGDGCSIGAGSFIGSGTSIGKNTELMPRVTIYSNCEIGSRVRMHSGVVIGADGFGYAPQVNLESQTLVHQKIIHFGRTIIEDDVEVGANSSIDRGTLGDTRIGRGTKIDNLVQIGHNVEIGQSSIVCGKVGIAGSAKIGNAVLVGGLSGISNQVVIGDRAKIGACSLVAKNVEPGSIVVGNPAREEKTHFKIQALLNRLLKNRGKKS